MKIKLIFALLLTTLGSFAQTSETLNTRAQELFASTNTMNLPKIMDLTYNKVFTFVDKNTLLEAMKSALNNEFMTVEILNPIPVPFKTDAIKTVEGKKFCVIHYHNTMKMTLKQKMDPTVISGMIDGMKKAANYSSVTFDDKTNSFLIEGDAILIAVADESTKNQWEFVNYDNKEMFNMVFNENIKKELGLN